MNKSYWSKVRLGDVIAVNQQVIDSRFPHSQIRYIDIAAVENRVVTGFQYLNLSQAPSRARRLVPDNSILISTVRPNLKHYVFIKQSSTDIVASTGFVIINEIPTISDAKFLYYYLTSDEFTKYLVKVAESQTSAYPAFNPEAIQEKIVYIPDLPTQKSIAAILSSLDDKIELLREQNKTLENIAQALFKRWFVDFEFPNEEGKPYKSSGGKMVSSSLGEIPVGWKIGAIGDLVIKTIDNRGKTPITSDINSDLLFPLVEVNSMVGAGRIVDISKIKKYVDRSTYETWFRAGHPIKKDILVSTVGSIGLVSQIWDEKITIAQNIIALRSNSGNFLYQLMAFLREKIIGLNISSVQPSIKVPHLMNLQIILPDADMIELYEYLVESYVSKIHSNNIQIQTLTRLRDSLLPKLMSRELNVEQI